jgi:16S rRNA (guanine527-N7)-methyltransferase
VAESAFDDGPLLEVLARARRLDLVGRTSPDRLIAHARGFVGAIEPAPRRALDLGSGAGLPGLVLALHWPDSQWTLVDASERRTTFLRDAVAHLDLDGRVAVEHGRAEDLAYRPGLRARIDLVVARSFGPPATVAECAAGFLAVGGQLVVSEPPGGDPDRWAPLGELDLGLRPERVVDDPAIEGTYQVLVQATLAPDHLPRRAGRPAKDPLF